MKFILYFTEYNSFKDESAFKSTQESEDWYENEYKIPFTASTLEKAKKIAHYKCDNSSGVFDVYDSKEQQLIFTEE